jgi:succinate-semialdehyde dehydrogenase/glutarate-semialdehyde dehydrogenase
MLRVGRGTDEWVTHGPLINARAVHNVHDLVLDAVSRGATLLAGGGPVAGPGTFFAPTVLIEVPSGARLLHEEIFGPVLPICSVCTEGEAVSFANETEYGLVAYAYTRDLSRAHRLIGSVRTGMLGINAGIVSNASAPFGGVKQSGLGREGGPEGIYEYFDTKYTLLSPL